MKRGDIYMVSLDPSSGHEQRGWRPVLIISPDRFNAFTKVPIVVPITSGGAFAQRAGFTVSLANTGSQTTGSIRCDQPRAMDILARNSRLVESLPQDVVEDVLSRLATILQ